MPKLASTKDSSSKKPATKKAEVQKSKTEKASPQKIKDKKGSKVKATEKKTKEVKEKTPQKAVEKKKTGIERLQQVVAGKTLTFGTYGGKKIEWIVLEKKSDKALLISRVCVDKHWFREDWKADDSNQWVASDIRSWLNKDFLKKGFSSEEQKRIIETRVTTDGCADTKDRIFLLSVEEAKRYFKTDEDRKCTLNGKSEWWWLRSPGSLSNNAADVIYDGGIVDSGIV